LRTRRYDPAAFVSRATPFLVRQEAMNNLVLGLAHTLAAVPGAYDEPAYLATVEQGAAPVLAAVRTPPHHLVLSTVDPTVVPGDALAFLADDVHGAFPLLPGAIGPREVAEAFAALWCRRTGASFRLAVAERIYELTQVRHPPKPPGGMRRATAADRDLLAEWLRAFYAEAAPEQPDVEGTVARTLRQRLGAADAAFYLWEDGSPVSLAGYAGPTPTGIRVGPVYTPPHRRGLGYASALVASLSQRLLDEGRARCFLFTDLANPTSNAIYQRIGYRPVGDVHHYVLEATAPGPFPPPERP
jgi:predicted GNAT family acetyltransferase